MKFFWQKDPEPPARLVVLMPRDGLLRTAVMRGEVLCGIILQKEKVS